MTKKTVSNSSKTVNLIKPYPGYIHCEAYIADDGVFKSQKETIGEDQLSTVISVGDDVMDSDGNMRNTPAKPGDIIIHTSTNKLITIFHEEVRFVHFTEVHGQYTDSDSKV